MNVQFGSFLQKHCKHNHRVDSTFYCLSACRISLLHSTNPSTITVASLVIVHTLFSIRLNVLLTFSK
ncbi:hypothetical protein EG68_10764 [Paragonimus skrjabini miyazakii]|uniref:Uncharacterized protein n=1 Tax=Paragonimus skrjabini miyazakii TaxID=59628 RepID=A0A8S9YCI3_9TREM|nr:hypothetical protein EG68_10764 [Paragonimus skrjabini miyazakii]